MENLKILFVMFVANLAPLLLYVLRRVGRRFDVWKFFIENRQRHFAGFAAVVVFTILLILLDVSALSGLLSPFSIAIKADGSKTGIAAALGFAFGTMQILALTKDAEKGK